MAKELLTDRQQEVFQFLQECFETKGLPPTVREIGEKFGISSTNGVRSILTALIKKGYIERKPNISRGLDLIKKQDLPKLSTHQIPSNIIEIPILGRVAAGLPILAVENLEGTVRVDREFLLRQSNVFALRVKGQSMRDAGILDGDMIFARQQEVADQGQIVVALLGDEATVKYFYKEKDRVRLEPANPTFRPIIVDSSYPEFRIAGRVIGIQRQYR